MMLVLLECVVDQGGPGEISHDGRLDQGWHDIVQACGSQDPAQITFKRAQKIRMGMCTNNRTVEWCLFGFRHICH